MAPTSFSPGLIDTDILIDAERGRPDAVAFVTAQQTSGTVRISIVSAMELIQGCRNAIEQGHVQQFLRRVTVVPIDESISQSARQLIETFHLSHGMLIPDALIAATAIAHGLPLYTKNVRHFQMVPGALVSRPYT